MKKLLLIIGIILVIFLIGFSYYKNIYNKEVQLNQQVKTQWAKVESAYQYRADLIPNYVNVVKGAADFERSTLTDVIEARAKATSVNVNPENLTPETFQQFQEAQNGLSSALGRLMVVVERYPDLKANQNFINLQVALEGTENRINVERMRFNETVGTYNTFSQQLMVKILFNYNEKPYFEANEGAEVAPTVEPFEF